MEEEKERYESWSILELMGHRKLAGFCKEIQIAGAGFIRIDVPGGPTQFYGPSAIYCLTPTTEAIARRIAYSHRPEPVSLYELPAPRSAAEIRPLAEDETCPNCHRSVLDLIGDDAVYLQCRLCKLTIPEAPNRAAEESPF